MKHIIYIPFTGVGIPGWRGDAWFEERIEVFKRTTLMSLKNQDNKDFVVWASFRPEELRNPLVDKIALALREANISFVFTFHGLMYHDDKYAKDINSRIYNWARLTRACWRRGDWGNLLSTLVQSFKDKNGSLLRRLSMSLPIVCIEISYDTKWVYVTRVDSDDMLRYDFVSTVQAHAPQTGALTCASGYIHNTTTGEICEYHPETNPPFHTIMFRSEIFFRPELHLAYYGDFKSHEDIPKVFNTQSLGDRMYCVTTHNPRNHISTIWNHPFRGMVVDRGILSMFGV